jgi:hypothetical protein
MPSFADTRITQSTSLPWLAPSIQRQSEQPQPDADGKDAAIRLYIPIRQSGVIDYVGARQWRNPESLSDPLELHDASTRLTEHNHWGASDRCDFPEEAVADTTPYVVRICRGRQLGRLSQLARFYIVPA